MKCLLFLPLFLLSISLQSQSFHADIRGTNDNTDGAMLQLATPNANHYLRLFSGRVGDPKPYIYFSESDTFRIASGLSNFSDFKSNVTILNGISPVATSTTFVGINNPSPVAELDIISSDQNDGAEIRISNADQSHFLRLFSGRQNDFPFPSIYWKEGDSLSLGTNAGGYSEKIRILSDGTMYMNSKKGIALDETNRPLITRGWDKFTSGTYTGVGRWGVFMEPNYLTLGMPDLASRGFQFVSYNEDGTIAQNHLRIKEGKVGINNSDPQYLLDVDGDVNLTSTLNVNGNSGTSGQVLTSNGASDPTWEDPGAANPEVAFRAYLAAPTTINADTILKSFSELFDDGSNFDAATGVFTTPSPGLYSFDYYVAVGTPGPIYANLPFFSRILKNGIITTGCQFNGKMHLTTSYGDGLQGSLILKLAAGDTISFTIDQTSGAQLFLGGGTGSETTWVSGFKIY